MSVLLFISTRGKIDPIPQQIYTTTIYTQSKENTKRSKLYLHKNKKKQEFFFFTTVNCVFATLACAVTHDLPREKGNARNKKKVKGSGGCG